jgi:hypothetical protein
VEAEIRQLPVGRILAVDDRGIGMRATWHLERGFINLSLWREDVCVETFHLTPTDAAHLVSFLVTGMAEVVEQPFAEPAIEAAPPPPSWWVRLRRELARRLAA